MVDYTNFDEAVLRHLHEIAQAKRALLQVALDIADYAPAQATLIINTIKGLTRSADKLLGDTIVEGPHQ